MFKDHMILSRLKGGFFLSVCRILGVALVVGLSVGADSRAAMALDDGDLLQEAGRTAVLDTLLQHAIQKELISGAVVLVGDRHGTLYTQAVGKAGFEPDAPPLRVDSVFDIASLTKVFATAPAVARLMDQGALSLLDPISRWFPEFRGSDITILNLLTHTSGLHDGMLDPSAPLESAIRSAANGAGKVPAGSRFKYADINFILLGNLVRRISSMGLDQYCHEFFYQPLDMTATTFNPGVGKYTAATLGPGRRSIVGVVQDGNARLLGGVAGHAGLFSTAADLSKFVRMVLNGGQLHGHRVLSAKSITQMTASYYFNNGRIVRGLGWDRESPYSAAKGTLFSDVSFGHTGYSGSSVWIDPESDLFVILLTTRLNYNNKRSFNRLRSDIATLAAALFAGHERHLMVKIPQNTHP